MARVVTGGTPVSPGHARRRLRAPRFRRRRQSHARGRLPNFHRAARSTSRCPRHDSPTHRCAPRCATAARIVDLHQGPSRSTPSAPCSASRSACRRGRTPAKAALALKTSPSGGARHSLEAYVWVRRVDQVALRALSLPSGRACAHEAGRPRRARHRDVVVAGTARLRRRGGRRRAVVRTRARGVALPERAGVPCRADRVRPSRADVLPDRHRARARAVLHRGTRGHGHRSATSGSTVGCSRRCTWSVPGRVVPGAWQPHAGQPAPRLEITELGRALADRVTRRSSGPRRRRRRASGR